MATIRSKDIVNRLTWRLARWLETEDFLKSDDSTKEDWLEYTEEKYLIKAKEILGIK